MATKVFNMEGGLHSAAAYSAFENRLYGSVKASADSFIVAAATGMNVTVSPGDGLISVSASLARRIQSDAPETVSVAAASTAYSRIDSVVAYIDTSVTPTTSVVDNTNGVLKFSSVAGTAASTPQAPNQAAIQASIGAGRPYMVIANITVPANATNLTSATFSNLAPTPLLKNYPIGAVFISVNSTSPQSLFGGAWEQFAAGRTLVGFNSGEVEFNAIEKTGGAKTHKLTIAEMPNHNHQVYSNAAGGTTANNAVFGNTNGVANIPTTSRGGDEPHNNLQPYITTYMWKRTA